METVYPTQTRFAHEDLAVAENQLVAYRARLGVPFQHDDYLKELTKLHDELKAGLAVVRPEEGAEPFDVAERVKALRAANTAEAVPQRTAKRQTSAEEPVTARIRNGGEWQRRVSEEERKAGRAREIRY